MIDFSYVTIIWIYTCWEFRCMPLSFRNKTETILTVAKVDVKIIVCVKVKYAQVDTLKLNKADTLKKKHTYSFTHYWIDFFCVKKHSSGYLNEWKPNLHARENDDLLL